jgi:hypothetical protein
VYIGVAAMSISMSIQTVWLGLRSYPVLRAVRFRDTRVPPALESVSEEAVAGYKSPAD